MSKKKQNLNINNNHAEIGSTSKASVNLTKRFNSTTYGGSINIKSQSSQIKFKTAFIPTPQKNWEIICDLQYSKYLNAILKMKILMKEVGQQDAILKSQLATQREFLWKTQETVIDKETKLLKLEQEKKLKTEIAEILKSLKETIQILGPESEIDLKILLKLFTECNHKLYINNVDSFEKLSDYIELEENIKKCSVVLSNLECLEANFNHLSNFSASTNKSLKLQEKVDLKYRNLVDMQHESVMLTVEQLSNLLM